jgi:hypothetical protein
MGFLVKTKKFEPVREGVHHAVCVGVYDLGMQYNDKFERKTHKCIITWELPLERIIVNNNDLPKQISKQYAVTLNEKSTLRKDLETWRGSRFTAEELKEYDLSALLSQNAQIQVMHKDNGERIYANVVAVLPLPKNMPELEPESNLCFFSFADNSPIPEDTPDWIVKLIKESDEWDRQEKVTAREEQYQQEESDVPF